MLPEPKNVRKNTLINPPTELKEAIHPQITSKIASEIEDFTLQEHSEWSETSHYSRHREMSILCDEPSKEMELAARSGRDLVIGVFWIVMMVTSCATIGPLVLTLPCESIYVSVVWRTQSGFLVMAVYMVYYYYDISKQPNPGKIGRKNGFRGVMHQIKKDFSIKNLGKSAMMALLIYVWMLGLIMGCKYTLTSHADVLYSSSGVFILLFSILSCQYVHKYEIGGYSIYAIGAAIMLTDPFAMKTGEDTNKVFGDFISFATALCGALYGILNNKLKRDYSQSVYMFHFLGINTIYQLTVGYFMDGNPQYFSFHPTQGVFGWIASPFHLIYLVCFIGPFTTVLSNVSLLMAYKYWTLDVVAAGFLVEPFVAQFTAIVLGQDEIPGPQTLIGISIISAGIILAIYGSKLKASRNIEDIKGYDQESMAEMSALN